MITVDVRNHGQSKTTWLVQELIGTQHCGCRTAFVGNVDNYLHKLFLVTYECIVLVENPIRTWNNKNIDVQVDFWCDLEITAKRL